MSKYLGSLGVRFLTIPQNFPNSLSPVRPSWNLLINVSLLSFPPATSSLPPSLTVQIKYSAQILVLDLPQRNFA